MSITVTEIQVPGPQLVYRNGIVTITGDPVVTILLLGSAFTSDVNNWPSIVGKLVITAYIWNRSVAKQWLATVVFTNGDLDPSPVFACGPTFQLDGYSGNDDSDDRDLRDELRRQFMRAR